jgi:hypothetical protein
VIVFSDGTLYQQAIAQSSTYSQLQRGITQA